MVIFRVAGGPNIGFGHLVRCRSLARALRLAVGRPSADQSLAQDFARSMVSVRGTMRTRQIASSMGLEVITGVSDAALENLNPSLVVVDDPSPDEAGKWVRKARRIGLPVATIHDLGLGHVESDLMIDGSVCPGLRPVVGQGLRGPSYAILDPSIRAAREEQRKPEPMRVLVALGGGKHVYPVAAALTRAISARVPGADIRVTAGFTTPKSRAVLQRATWVTAPSGLADELSSASVAVVSGGVTLYEACALGVPAVGFAVVPAQYLTVRGMVCQGAVIDGGKPYGDVNRIERAADCVASLLQNDRLRKQQSTVARRLVDGRGAFRVAERLLQLAKRGQTPMEGSNAA